MKTRCISLLSLFILLAGLSISSFSEGVQETSAPQIVVEDALGRSVTLPESPKRIVTAGKAVIMIVDALYLFSDVGERVAAVGFTDQGMGDFFPVLEKDAGKTARLKKNVGPEEILARNPDLVLLKSYLRDSLGKPIETAGVPVVYLDLETPEQFERDLRILGTLLEQEDRAEELISMMDQKAAELRSRVEGRPQLTVALFSVNSGNSGYSFSVAPQGWIQAVLVQLAGGEPVWTEAVSKPGWNQVGFEQIARWDPEVMVLLSFRGATREVRESVQTDSLWGSLTAVRNDRIYSMPADFYSWGQPDPRWILGAQWLARVLHPEAFDSPFEEDVAAFFRDFYGIGKERFEREIRPRISGDFF
ncbi:ABC transporter substrate-binding protein [Marispirochaeta sp.]|jgi:iron complex transport system substrate-binding protein|uniref:ABC transporter substrate-binding protein n=1 Tax=Marispirochaeta sp. TaxID=2038653 RepID=UPI0029C82182|nr:ABC transporter substrate-binding protein [Marispirochaeta sp.]